MIICNSTPLIAFARIGRLRLLKKIVGELVIPTAVADEISDYGPGQPGFIDISQETWIKKSAVKSQRQAQLLLPVLDLGEAEVITLALEKSAKLVLIDELTGRHVAESLGLRVTGSVGILIRAKESGEIDAIKPYLDEMIRQGVRYGKRFIDQVLKNAGE